MFNQCHLEVAAGDRDLPAGQAGISSHDLMSFLARQELWRARNDNKDEIASPLALLGARNDILRGVNESQGLRDA